MDDGPSACFVCPFRSRGGLLENVRWRTVRASGGAQYVREHFSGSRQLQWSFECYNSSSGAVCPEYTCTILESRHGWLHNTIDNEWYRQAISY